MKKLFYLILTFLILSCTYSEDELTKSFFKNSDFIEIVEGDTIHLSFLDTTYSLLTVNGIQHKNSLWSIKTLGEEQILLLGKYNPRVLQVISFTDTSCTLKGIGQTEDSPFVLLKGKNKSFQIKGLWKSSKIPPPPDYFVNNPDILDSIFTNDALWESEVFEITEDSIKYSFYGYKTVVKYERPFIQLENDINAANGRLSVLRPISQNDSALTLEFYYTDGNQSLDRENKKWIRKLKR
jgi:hypothetical protein